MSTQPTAIRVMRMMYPNKAEYYAVFYGNERVGSFDIVEGGFQPQHGRKVVPTIEAAVRDLIGKRIVKARKDITRFAGMLLRPIEADDGCCVSGRIAPSPSRIEQE